MQQQANSDIRHFAISSSPHEIIKKKKILYTKLRGKLAPKAGIP